MAVHNLVMFHCQKCGRLVNQEFDEAIPYCCGKSMTKAAEKTDPPVSGNCADSTNSSQSESSCCKESP